MYLFWLLLEQLFYEHLLNNSLTNITSNDYYESLSLIFILIFIILWDLVLVKHGFFALILAF